MRMLIIFVFISFLFGNCNNQLFSLHTKNDISLKVILQDLVDRCGINVIFKDEKSKKMLNKKVTFINIDKVNLKDFLDIVFDNVGLFYKLKRNTLYVAYYKTETLKINYIPTKISGSTGVNSNDNKVQSDFEFDFWSDLKNNIIQLLKNEDENYKEPIIDKNSGLVSVTGNKRQISVVKKYIDNLNKRLHKEVMIDVQIYSVTLSKSHKTGIDWSKLNIALPEASVPLRMYNVFGRNSVFKSATFNVSALLNFLAQNGDVNSISNPKIVTLNNQKAIIKVGDTVYYKYISNTTNTENNNNSTVEYKIENQFVGVLLDITPQISDNNEVILSINPRISAFKDPSQLQNLNRDLPPDIKENSLISVVRLRNNETLILGGLISNDKTFKVNGVPILKEIPILKYLFSSKESISERKELVFVITPHIIDLSKKVNLRDYGYGKLPSLKDLDVK